VMGEESRARQEYADAIAKVNDKVEALRWSLLAAITYVRENDFTAADKAFQNVAKQAHQNGLGIVEAEAYRDMALYQRQSAAAKTALNQADAALHHQHQTPQSLRDQELASIMRTRVERALRDGDLKLAVNSLKPLEALSSGTIDGSIHLYYESAAGALALARKNYSAAISHLSDNEADPLSLLHLMEAYKQLGRSAEAQSVATRLAALNLPTIDQAVIVPAFRKTQLAAPKSSVNTGNR
jgi:hypothetical protein